MQSIAPLMQVEHRLVEDEPRSARTRQWIAELVAVRVIDASSPSICSRFRQYDILGNYREIKIL